MSDSEAKKKGGAPQNEDEIATKQIVIGYKRFFIDVKQNARGRFIKIAEMGNGQKSRVALTMGVANTIVDKLSEYLEFCDATPVMEKREDPVDLKQDVINYDTRRYFLDLRENSRGRFLSLAQTTQYPRPMRSRVAIPAEGLKELRDTMADFLARFGDGFIDTPNELAKTVKSDFNKTFYFDSAHNERGSFVRISEVKLASGFRTSITVPASSLKEFRKTLDELINELSLDSKTDVEA